MNLVFCYICIFKNYTELISWELTSWEVDLVGIDLMGVDLMGVDFVGVDLVGGHPFSLKKEILTAAFLSEEKQVFFSLRGN